MATAMVEGGKGRGGMERLVRGATRQDERRGGEDDARKRERGGRNEVRDARANRERERESERAPAIPAPALEGISGHYFLQYFNVKSTGFPEPSYRFPREETERSRSSHRAREGCSGEHTGERDERNDRNDGSKEERKRVDAGGKRRGGGRQRKGR